MMLVLKICIEIIMIMLLFVGSALIIISAFSRNFDTNYYEENDKDFMPDRILYTAAQKLMALLKKKFPDNYIRITRLTTLIAGLILVLTALSAIWRFTSSVFLF